MNTGIGSTCEDKGSQFTNSASSRICRVPGISGELLLDWHVSIINKVSGWKSRISDFLST